MAFDVKRAENIAYGFKDWIHKGKISYDNAVKRIKATYRPDMATEIIRILEKEIREVGEKCRWALVFSDVEEAEKAREKLSWRNIYPDSQEKEKLLWTDKEEAEYAREHVGGLIEPWGKPTLIPREEEIAEVAERQYGNEILYSVGIFYTRPEHGEDVKFLETHRARTVKGADYIKDIMTKAFTKAHPTWTIKRVSVKEEEK